MAEVTPIPPGYAGATPYLIVHDGAAALAFYHAAFGAAELFRIAAPGGRVGHAEMKLAGGIIMLADEAPDCHALSPRTIGGSPVSFVLYVADVDAVFARAVAAGAKVERPVETKFYGDRSGSVKDPFGHVWHISTHVEDVPPDELARRAAALMPPTG